MGLLTGYDRFWGWSSVTAVDHRRSPHRIFCDVGKSIIWSRVLKLRELGRSGYELFSRMAAPLSPILLAVFLLAITSLWRRLKQSHRNLSLPPGPKQWPFIGCLLQMPKVFQQETYREWSRQYGDYSFPLIASLRVWLSCMQVLISSIWMCSENRWLLLINMKLLSSFSTKGLGFTQAGLLCQSFLKSGKDNV